MENAIDDNFADKNMKFDEVVMRERLHQYGMYKFWNSDMFTLEYLLIE